jgi:TolB protein
MIYTMDPSGVEKKVKRISYVGKFNAAPKFSPDGKYIAFSSWVDNRFDIYRIDSTGKNLVSLTKNFGSNEEPYFSPDGQFIVFTSQRVITSKTCDSGYLHNDP